MFCAVIFNWFRAVGLPAALPDVFSQRVLLFGTAAAATTPPAFGTTIEIDMEM